MLASHRHVRTQAHVHRHTHLCPHNCTQTDTHRVHMCCAPPIPVQCSAPSCLLYLLSQWKSLSLVPMTLSLLWEQHTHNRTFIPKIRTFIPKIRLKPVPVDPSWNLHDCTGKGLAHRSHSPLPAPGSTVSVSWGLSSHKSRTVTSMGNGFL